MKRFLWGVARAAFHALSVFGTIYTVADPVAALLQPQPQPQPLALGDLTGPGSGHPERVRTDVPLTPLERALSRELRSP